MPTDDQRAKADRLRALHERGTFVVPNAWDAGSAVVIAATGAPAIATTSAGVSWALGRPDGHGLTMTEMAAAVERIAAVVDVPVSADIEGGYGDGPDAVASTVEAVVAAGAVGVNIEDSIRPGGPPHEIAAQADRLRAARAAAERAGLPGLVINARTDVYLFGIGPEDGRFNEVVARSAAFAQAGADSLFVPGLLDLDTLRALAERVTLPINAMVGPGAPDVTSLGAAGVRRVSLGAGIALAAYSLAKRSAAEALTKGTYAELAGSDGYPDIAGLFHR